MAKITVSLIQKGFCRTVPACILLYIYIIHQTRAMHLYFAREEEVYHPVNHQDLTRHAFKINKVASHAFIFCKQKSKSKDMKLEGCL